MLSKQTKTKILRDAQNGNYEQLKQLKHTHPDYHWRQLQDPQTGDTLLHKAAHYGLIELLRYLLENYTPKLIDYPNKDGKTALHEACQASQRQCVNFLLQNGANIDALKRADWTPLMLACTKDCVEIVEILLQYKPLIDWCNKDGWTSLHLACRTGCWPIVRLLLDHGANYRAKTNNGRTIYHIVALHNHRTLLIELLQLNLDLSLDEPDTCGNTALHEAVLGGNFEIYRLIKTRSTSLYGVNKAGYNLLHLACSVGCKEIIYDLVVNERFDVDELIANTPGVRPVHCAYRNHKFDTLEYLKELGANLQANDSFNRTLSDYNKD